MTALQLASYINREGTINTGAFNVGVRVVDVKESFGRLRYLVTPLSGSGEMWTETVTLG